MPDVTFFRPGKRGGDWEALSAWKALWGLRSAVGLESAVGTEKRCRPGKRGEPLTPETRSTDGGFIETRNFSLPGSETTMMHSVKLFLPVAAVLAIGLIGWAAFRMAADPVPLNNDSTVSEPSAANGTAVDADRLVVTDPPAVGDPAPEFTLVSNEGAEVSLSDYRDKWVVLYFYPKDFTSGCTIQAKNFERDLDQYEARNAVVLGVSVQSTESHQEFCTKEGLSFKILSDEETIVSDTYGSLGENKLSTRNTFVINPEGIVAKVFLKVNPNPHSQEVLAALDELQAPAAG